MAALGLCCCTQAFSSCCERRGYSSLRCMGFLWRWLLLLQSTGSRCTTFSSCGSQAPERRLSSCGTWALLLRGKWDLPGPELEPMSPTLAGGFSTTEPPGKSHYLDFLDEKHEAQGSLTVYFGYVISILWSWSNYEGISTSN